MVVLEGDGWSEVMRVGDVKGRLSCDIKLGLGWYTYHLRGDLELLDLRLLYESDLDRDRDR